MLDIYDFLYSCNHKDLCMIYFYSNDQCTIEFTIKENIEKKFLEDLHVDR
jgi:hypothetical protein